ncbi:EamA family transporter [Cohnella nanjingensis]|uniref:EamA family transporter n=1 Tax=Cohnella nanjingensis TaxID=1387779 RepID=A0A7X0RM74_9BACL|nr:EamA family transporter [Cohnella nanjingensis]
MLGIALFTVLYSSGAIIMKIGLHSASPLTLAPLRFITAGLLLLIYIYVFKKENTLYLTKENGRFYSCSVY